MHLKLFKNSIALDFYFILGNFCIEKVQENLATCQEPGQKITGSSTGKNKGKHEKIHFLLIVLVQRHVD